MDGSQHSTACRRATRKVEPGARWALSGDRGITYAGAMPKDTIVTEGKWWPPDYTGPTLISFDAELAAAPCI